jgi:DNA-directed RNA polymerase subunit M/transcription elongation factor TFIIS
MTAETKRWIEAGKVLAEDPAARVSCPKCEDSTLEVEDVRNPNAPEELERIMRCGKCGAMNALRLRRPSEI